MPAPDSFAWYPWLLFGVQVATFFALAIYVWKTGEIASATRRAAEAATLAAQESFEARAAAYAPRVVVYFNPEEIELAQVVIENVGSGTAEDVEISFEPPLPSTFEEKEPPDFFGRPHPILPPGYRISHVFGEWTTYLKKELPGEFNLSLRYRGVENGREYVLQQRLDVRALQRMSVDRKTTHHIANYVEQLDEHVRAQLGNIEKTLQKQAAANVPREIPVRATGYAVSMLLTTWKVYSLLAEETSGWNHELVGSMLRTDALAAAHAAARSNTPDPLQRALSGVLALLLGKRSLGDSYSERLREAFANLENAFIVRQTPGA